MSEKKNKALDVMMRIRMLAGSKEEKKRIACPIAVDLVFPNHCTLHAGVQLAIHAENCPRCAEFLQSQGQ